MASEAHAQGVWRELGVFPPAEIGRARLQAHIALQPLVHITRAYLEPAADDSHNSFEWSQRLDALVTGQVRGGSLPFRLGLRISTLSVLLIGRGDTELGLFSLHGKTIADERNWLALRLAQGGLDWAVLDVPLHYSIESLGFSNKSSFVVTEELTELSRYFANAAMVLEHVAETETGASPVRCWPHHFDIATLQWLKPGKQSVGVGLSPGDEEFEQPYFYVTPSPVPAGGALPALRQGGKWHRGEWIGAVLSAQEIIENGNARDQEHAVRSWLDEAAAAAKQVLLVS